MIDREKVIKGLECCVYIDKCKACPYESGTHCTIDIMRDALELLKEYDEMAGRYSKILMETTGGRLSKTGYDVGYIMDCIREHYCDGCDVQEERDALLKAQETVKPETQRDSEWISVKERLPDERETIFAKLYGTDKWRPQMFRKMSDDVRVVCVFEDGTRKVWHDNTQDGKWASERPGKYPVRHIAYWMENPELPKGGEVG